MHARALQFKADQATAHQSRSMDRPEQQSLVAIPITVLIGAGLAVAGSHGGQTVFGMPVFALCIGVAFTMQWIAFIPAFLKQTEMFYDLVGSVTYVTVVALAVIFSTENDARTVLLFVMVCAWAVRLGSFLVRRIHARGEDRRFRGIKTSFTRFLLAWTVQGLWVSFSLAAALAAMTSSLRIEPGPIALAGFLVWAIGFAIEIIADRQKSRFRDAPGNAGKFISTGLWAWSRHPNYFGEIILWIGVAILAAPALSGWQWLTLISPVFVIVLLIRISGIPMLEERADKTWGGQAAYEDYKARTPVLLPRPPAA